jgi:hypothetical protein
MAGRLLGATLAVAIILGCVLQIEDIQKLSLTLQIVSWAVIALICPMELMYVFLFFTTKSPDNTIATIPAVAMRQPRLPKPLRPVVAVFWLVHFFFIIALIYGLHESSGAHSSLAGWVGIYFLALLFHFLAFGYLLLTVTAFTKDAEIIAKLWKRRALISSVVALLSTFAPFFLPVSIG